MAKFEKENIYPLTDGKSLCYYRFMDDIFTIWTGSTEELLTFFEQLNSKHTSIKFDCKYSTKEIDFLDTTVYITSSNTISTRIFKKETDRNAYLHYKSYHPKKQKDNIPYGQFLRAKKICSNTHDADLSMSNTKIKFLERGYPSIIVDEQLEKAKLVEKSTLLKENDKQNTERRVPFTATFNANLPKISSTINKHWLLRHTNAKIAESMGKTHGCIWAK